VIKSRRIRWAGHAARTRDSRGVYRVLVEKPEGEDLFEDSGVDGSIILSRIFRKWGVRAWSVSIWLRVGTGDGHL
jgi:hypothetical protein